jgi:hypothetical protein
MNGLVIADCLWKGRTFVTNNEEMEKIAFGAICLKCHHTQPPLDAVAERYFCGEEILCRNAECNAPVDYWESTVNWFKETSVYPTMLISLGAEEKLIEINLKPYETKQIDLTAYQIPADATLLNLVFTSERMNCIPTVIDFNRVWPRPIGTKFFLYGIPVPDVSDEGPISALVLWVHKDDESNSWSYLLDGFEAMAAKRFRSVILPAFSAFEVSLSPLVLNGLRKHLPKKVVKDFEGQDSFSSSSALNVLLPLLCKEAKLPTLPEKIQTQLNILRKLRNEIAHEGLANAEVTQRSAGESLCASVFGLEYLRYIRPRLLGNGC